MESYDLICPCHFGLESVLKKEIVKLGYEISRVEDGRVLFKGDSEAVARANIFLRTAERVLICVGEFTAKTFDELFEGTKALPWEEFIPKDGRFWVKKAASVKSALFSPSDIQRIMKKAMVERLKLRYGISHFEESGNDYPLRVFLYKDRVTVALDTTGESLHKRGYRKKQGTAPIAENLAAGLLMLTKWNKTIPLIDPFCGSGTIAIEAALMAANMAPGAMRDFTAMDWSGIVDKKSWYRALDEARSLSTPIPKSEIQGYDIDPAMVRISRENAERAEVLDFLHFQERDVKDLKSGHREGIVVTNPPYGERMEENEELHEAYRSLGSAMRGLKGWEIYVISSYEKGIGLLGKKPDKNRKIYNGMLKTYFYSFSMSR